MSSTKDVVLQIEPRRSSKKPITNEVSVKSNHCSEPPPSSGSPASKPVNDKNTTPPPNCTSRPASVKKTAAPPVPDGSTKRDSVITIKPDAEPDSQPGTGRRSRAESAKKTNPNSRHASVKSNAPSEQRKTSARPSTQSTNTVCPEPIVPGKSKVSGKILEGWI